MYSETHDLRLKYFLEHRRWSLLFLCKTICTDWPLEISAATWEHTVKPGVASIDSTGTSKYSLSQGTGGSLSGLKFYHSFTLSSIFHKPLRVLILVYIQEISFIWPSSLSKRLKWAVRAREVLAMNGQREVWLTGLEHRVIPTKRAVYFQTALQRGSSERAKTLMFQRNKSKIKHSSSRNIYFRNHAVCNKSSKSPAFFPLTFLLFLK